MTKEPIFPTGIDSTMRSAFVSCPRKFYYSYCLRLTSIEGKSIHLHAGGAFAAGCEAYRISYFTPPLSTLPHKERHEEALLAGYIALIKHWGSEPMHLEESKSLPNMLLALREYFTTNNPRSDYITPHFIKDKDGKEKPCVEVNFAIPLPSTSHPITGDEILYVGRYDLIGEYNKQLYVVDEKTTSRLGPLWGQQWEMRGQFIGYCFAAREFGIPVVGAIVRGLSILKNSFGHAFIPLTIPTYTIDTWHQQLIRDIKRMRECWDTKYFDQNFGDACSAYSGCEFKTLCMSKDPEAWESSYKHNAWNPLHTEEEMEAERIAFSPPPSPHKDEELF